MSKYEKKENSSFPLMPIFFEVNSSIPKENLLAKKRYEKQAKRAIIVRK